MNFPFPADFTGTPFIVDGFKKELTSLFRPVPEVNKRVSAAFNLRKSIRSSRREKRPVESQPLLRNVEHPRDTKANSSRQILPFFASAKKNIDGFIVYFLRSIVDVFQLRLAAFIFQQSLNAGKRLKAHARVTPYARKPSIMLFGTAHHEP